VRFERGVALLSLLAILAIGATWFLVRDLNTESGVLPAVRKQRNAEVLNRAKQALIGYVAAQAAIAGENRPGALPCPEAPGNFNNAANEGTISFPCTPPRVGRFPWRSLGLDKLVDAAGEPLWYAVAAGWAGANTVINSNCAFYNAAGLACQSGRLSVDGVPAASSDVIALIIAPGPVLNVPASAACGAAWSQVRSTVAPPDWRNYLECENATNPADMNFATTGPSNGFNDQLVTITVGELLPAVEAAIAHRIQREIVPVLQTVYAPPSWGIPGSAPIYPYAAPFANPSTSGMGGSTATIGGTPAVSSGLMPLATSETFPGSRTLCTSDPAAPLCQPDFVAWQSGTLTGAGMLTPTCAPSTPTTLTCTFYRICLISCSTAPTYNYSISATILNVGMALRQQSVNTAGMTNVGAMPTVAPLTLAANGSASFSMTGTATATTGIGFTGALGNLLCGLLIGFDVCKEETITIPLTSVLVDHPLLDSSTTSGTGWFIRNKWHELAYYSVVQGYTPASISAPGCNDNALVPPVTCLNVANVTPANGVRALLVLAGRSINGNARPSATLADYFEFGNGTGGFEQQAVTRTVLSAYADTGTANAYAIAAPMIVVGQALRFKAANANTGISTLNTAATGTRPLRNANLIELTAGQIQAQAMVEIDYDGAQFILRKRPFNDRIVPVAAN